MIGASAQGYQMANMDQEEIQGFQQTISTQKQELQKLLLPAEYQQFLQQFEQKFIESKKHGAEQGLKNIERQMGNLQSELRPSLHRPTRRMATKARTR